MNLRLYFCLCTVFLFVNSLYAQKNGIWNVSDFGAKGDGVTLNTKSIQSAIDACYQEGGGTVLISGGKYISGTIYMKSNIMLYINNGTTLQSSHLQKDFPNIPSKYPSYSGEFVTNRMLIYAEDAKNIVIEGKGILDGNGKNFEKVNESPSFRGRPRIIHIRNCNNVKIRDVTLCNSATWAQSYQTCENLLIEGITVFNRENLNIEDKRFAAAPGQNNDGTDIIDCKNVKIANCYVNSDDDGICIKSLSRNSKCENIVITNCVVSSNASGIKIGTETAGHIQDIIVQNCTVYDTRVDGLSIMTVDGARIERIIFSDITLRNIKGAAIFLRLGSRGRLYRKEDRFEIGHLKDISINNIYGNRIGRYGCSITGIPNYPIENISLTNIDLCFDAKSTKLEIDGRDRIFTYPELVDVPEFEKAYPRGEMFGYLPSYGLFLRHINEIKLRDVTFKYEGEEKRTPLIAQSVVGLTINNFSAMASVDAPALIHLDKVRKALICQSSSLTKTNTFIKIDDKASEDITLLSNYFVNVKNKMCIGDSVPSEKLKELNSIE